MDIDIEELNTKYDTLIQKNFKIPTIEDAVKYLPLIKEMIACDVTIKEKAFQAIKRKYTFSEKNSYIYHMFEMVKDQIENSDMAACHLRKVLKIKKGKSHSGVLVITIFTSPYPEYYDEEKQEVVKQSFSCKWNCHYCPNEPDQPRSYLKGEPGVMRANRNEFDCLRQMHDRMRTLYIIGHPVDKLEVIVLGGTWESYPLQYREQFCRDIYYSANVFGDAVPRGKLSLHQEKTINKTARCKVIGLTLETRPDTITLSEVRLLRSYGCTRVQLGIQHINEDILKKINRKCTTPQVEAAIKLLKDTGFKVDGHWMPNLPGSSPEIDKNMFIDVLLSIKGHIKRYTHPDNKLEYEEYNMTAPNLQVDQWKVYPCATVPWTMIEKWFKEGTYVPYAEDELLDLILEIKTMMLKWIRLNRIIRDIPSDYIISKSGDRSNMRQDALAIMQKEGKSCMCIRCREVKSRDFADETPRYIVNLYNASNGFEYFIEATAKDGKTLLGFTRLRIPSPDSQAIMAFPELQDCAFIRELHVYGQLQEVGNYSQDAVQHKGIGRHLIDIAENIASKHHSYKKMAIIAGEGTKGYYEKLGYKEDSGNGGYMMKIL